MLIISLKRFPCLYKFRVNVNIIEKLTNRRFTSLWILKRLLWGSTRELT